jgi:hypothetical protein
VRRAITFGIGALVACSAKAFAPASFIDTVRVLAVTADKPFAAPGENVQLQALVVDPNGGARPIGFAFGMCINPGSGEIADCVARLGPMKKLTVMDELAPFGVTIPTDALAGLSLPVGTVGVVFAACAGTFVDQPRAFGAPIGCIDPNGALVSRDGFVWGMKRITVLDGIRNENPLIDKIFVGGGGSLPEIPPIEPCPAGVQPVDCAQALAIDVFPKPNAAETYPDPLDLRQTRTEDVVLFSFASQGDFNDEVVRAADPDGQGMRFKTSWAPVAIDPSKPIEFWFVLRDDRGGMSFEKRTATLK